MRYYGFARPTAALKKIGVAPRVTPGPVTEANFVDGVFSISGEAKTFGELFKFSRTGPAWLHSDAGIIAYPTDTPRFRGGLVIEEGLTNGIPQSKTFGDNAVPNSTKETTPMGVKFTSTANMQGINIFRGYPLGTGIRGALLKVAIVKKGDSRYFSLRKFGASDGFTLDTVTGNILQVKGGWAYSVEDLGGWWQLNVPASSSSVANSSYDIGWGSSLGAGVDIITKVGDAIEISHMMMSATNTSKSTPIPTAGAPVTRNPDKITLVSPATEISGDWDATLTLTLEAGALKHSGHGTIRQLTLR